MPILVITGPIGAGKTTVANQVVEQWGAPVAYLEGDVFWKFFARPLPAETQKAARQRDARILVQALIASAARFARGGYDVVCDFTIGPWGIEAISTKLETIPLDLVVLQPSEGVCAERAARRDAGCIEDYAPYRELYAAFTQLGRFEKHAIRDDDAEPGELAARILSGLRVDAFRV